MKIKTDFVTNSSSTAYVVLIPNAFYADDNELQEEHQRVVEENDIITSNELLYKELPECIELLKEGDSLTREYSDEIFYSVLGICENHGFVLTSLQMNGELNTYIQGVKEEQVENIFFENADLMSIFKLIRKGGENVTAKIE